MTDQEQALPPEVMIAWGLDERSRRGTRPGLSLDRITAAAIAIADADGLGAIAMGRVATALGFTTMALYRYVESKDQLLTLMVDAAIGPAPKARSSGAAWREGLAIWVQALKELYMARPWIIDVPISGAPMMPNQLDWLDWALAIMQPIRLAPAEQISTALLLSGYARGEARVWTDVARAQRASGRTQQEEDIYYSRVLTTLVKPDRMPALYALVSSGLFTDTLTPELEDDAYFFGFGLERILDGIEHYLDRRRDEH
ncbi:MAG: TetR/AcrR family transcriptional regulator C-terminal domain-containing protein [Chloroflexota bacterium]|nr:TetR/AcrR family transcriptional regulator C-terminal domain-containing protein [Chloroflexota bacterium]